MHIHDFGVLVVLKDELGALEHSDHEIVGTSYKLVLSVVIGPRHKLHRANIVTSDRPEFLLSIDIEARNITIATGHDQWLSDPSHLAEGQAVEAIGYLVVKHVRVLFDIVDEKVGLRPNE